MASTDTPTDHAGRVDLALEGLHCASCVARVEDALIRTPGVSAATVNLATERAAIAFDPDLVDPDRLVSVVTDAGYGAQRVESRRAADLGTSGDRLALRTFVAVALAIPTLLLSMVPALQFAGWGWLAGALATPVVLWCAWPFHRGAYAALRHRTASMDTLISLGVLTAWISSIAALFLTDAASMPMEMSLTARGSTGALTFEVAAVVTALLLLGRLLETRARRRAGDAVRALAELTAAEATVLIDGAEIRMPTEEIAVGALVVVRPGERIPVDGVVEEGASALDRSLLTGESLPVEIGIGDAVDGGSLSSTGRLVVRATRVGADTAAARITALVEQAQTQKARAQHLADRIAGWFVPVVIAIAVASLAGWLLTGAAFDAALAPAIAVLVVACPCALGLAVPAALLVATGRGAQLGILLRGAPSLERAQRIDAIVLDKTGTVTEGRMALVAVHPSEGVDPNEALGLAAAVEVGSEHPIGRALAAAVDAPPTASGFVALPGIGAEADVNGRRITVGSPARLAARGLSPDPNLTTLEAAASEAGRALAAVAWDGRIRALFAFSDQVRPTSAAAVQALRSIGVEPILLTGDGAAAARAVAEEVGIERVVAEVLPADKVAAVTALRDEGRAVVMLGDGINDAPALAAADLGIAMGSGADIAMEAADVTLVRPDPLGAVDALRLARRTMATIKGNLFWAFAYNVVLIPAAALGFLNPMLSGLAMALSSLFVLGNSLRLKRFAPTRRPGAY